MHPVHEKPTVAIEMKACKYLVLDVFPEVLSVPALSAASAIDA